MAPRPIIIDTDPGQDDAIAILLALASEEFEVLGITVVAGNVPLKLTEMNARKICELAGKPETKVFAGCARPLMRSLVTAEEVHGKTGLDGPELPDPTMPLQDQHAVDWLVETLRAASPASITLCTLGPLTNVAAALVKAPDIAGKIAEIVMMGGGFFEGGNVTPAAEFNIYVDAHAAKVVFESGAPLTMLGLDVTHKVLVNRPRLEAIRDLGTPVGQAAAGLVDFFNRFDSERYEADGAPLHDPCVIAQLIDPSLFSGKECHVSIETEGSSRGRTNVDWFPREQRDANALVIDSVDADSFFALLTQRLATL